jgi:hypothetical protein
MPWFKVDDRLHASRKVKSIPKSIRLEAMGLWVISGSWAAGEPLDGFIPDFMVEDFGGRPELVAALVASGLWVAADEGAAFHAWTEYNPDAETLAAAKEAKSEGAKHANHQRWHVKRRVKVAGCQWCIPGSDGDQITDRFSDIKANPPDPTRPDPIDSYVPEVSLVSSEVETTSRPDVEHILTVLDEELRRNGSKVPARSKKNTDAARLLLDRDGRTVDQIVRAIHWCQSDEFWRSNILSMSKLREKYDQLRLAATRTTDRPHQSKAAQNAAKYRELFADGPEGSVPALDAGVRS